MKNMNKYLKQTVISAIVLGIFAGAIFGAIKYKENKKEEKAKKEFAIKLKQKKKEQEYKLTLTQTTDTINSAYTESKPMADLMSGLWHDNCFGNIYGFNLTIKYGLKSDITDKILQPLSSGSILPCIKQGQLSIVHIFVLKYEQETGVISKIDSLSSNAKTQVDKLKNPPKKYKELYDKVLTYYTDMNSYVGLTKQPQGNYEQYTTKMTDLSTKLQSEYSQINMMIQ